MTWPLGYPSKAKPREFFELNKKNLPEVMRALVKRF